MKKFSFLVCLSFVVMNSWGQLLYEPFNYTPDATNGIGQQSSSVWVRINAGDSMLVTSGNLTYSGLPASTGNKVSFDGAGSDNYIGFTSQTTGTVYSSFILNVTSLGGMTTTGGYFTGFSDAATSTTFGATVWLRLSSTAGKYNIGIATRTTAAAISWLPGNYDPATPYFIVRAYEMITGTGNDVGKIWVNPVLGGTEPAADAIAAVGTDLSSVQKVFLRQDALATTPFIDVDEFRVGTTWASVTPGAVVPTLSISSPLATFGNVCINTTSISPNAFTISGTNLTTANVTVAALPGYTYSTTLVGTYTPTLSLSQPGGTYSQQIFVNFTPTAVQSYDGNIAVAGGGAATPVSQLASGNGVYSAPLVQTGAASAITQVGATVIGLIPLIGCSAITTYGIEYSTISGFPNGSGTQVASTNLTGALFSSNLTGLSPGTTYFYKAYATNGGGTTYGTQQSFTTASPNPTINVTALTAFGNVCTNATAGPNSFTISGANLTTANVTVAALAGYTYSTTAAGTYTSSLSLTQPGGTYSQQIFVRFTPTAVQTYNGNIAVAGGGVTAPTNVAASGAGINAAPSVTTGAPSAITQNTATAAGSISATGCTAVTTYGIEYSLTNNFPNGTGTQVASTNLSAGNFTSALSGLTPSTTYYYKAYATNGGGTAYGPQQSFTTAAPPPPALTATTLTPFGTACINTTPATASFTINGTNLTTAALTVGPLTGFTFSETLGGTYTPTLTITQTGGTQSKTVFVKFTPTLVQTYNGNIPVSGGGAPAINVAAAGDGVNTLATVTTGASSNLTTQSVTLAGSIAANGCSNVTAYGIEYSGINGFVNGAGTKAVSTNLAAGSFTSSLTGLVQGTTYYYKAYAVNSGGTSYGLQQTFTVPAIGNGFVLYPVPVERGNSMKITMNNITPGYYGLLFFNSDGKLTYQKDINIQANFINQSFTIPATMAKGSYRVQLVSYKEIIATKSILIL